MKELSKVEVLKGKERSLLRHLRSCCRNSSLYDRESLLIKFWRCARFSCKFCSLILPILSLEEKVLHNYSTETGALVFWQVVSLKHLERTMEERRKKKEKKRKENLVAFLVKTSSMTYFFCFVLFDFNSFFPCCCD